MIPLDDLTAPRVLIVEDLPEISQWLVQMVGEVYPMFTVSCAASLAVARQRIKLDPVYVLALIDLGLPDGSGIDLIRELTLSHPDTQLIVVTIYDDDAHLFDALAAGAQGYLLKDQSDEIFQQHLTLLAQGVPALSPSIARRMLSYFHATPERAATPKPATLTVLTPRETDVLSCIGRGMRISQAAKTLNISEHTASGYVKDIYRKLNISSRAEAALEADRRGLT
jgi:DNA-binding NarL/FixJ family response regulator